MEESRRRKERNQSPVLFRHSHLKPPADTITSSQQHKGLSPHLEKLDIMVIPPCSLRMPLAATPPPIPTMAVTLAMVMQRSAMKTSSLTLPRPPVRSMLFLQTQPAIARLAQQARPGFTHHLKVHFHRLPATTATPLCNPRPHNNPLPP